QVTADGVDGDPVVAGQLPDGDLTALSDELGNAATSVRRKGTCPIGVRCVRCGHAPFLARAANKGRELQRSAACLLLRARRCGGMYTRRTPENADLTARCRD